MLDEADEATLTLMGKFIMEDVVSAIFETAWWAIYLTLFGVAAYIQITKGLRTKGSMIMLAVTLLLFTSSTALWAMNIAVLFVRQKERMLWNKDMVLADRISHSNESISKFGPPVEALFLLNMIIGDIVVIWRAWVLWTVDRIRRILVIPLVLLTISIVFASVDISCLVSESFGSRSAIPDGPRTCRWAEPISWATSVLTNLVATALIAIKAWEHRRWIRKGMGRNARRSRVQKLLLLLVESGFIYCLFWIFQVMKFFSIPRDTGGVFYFFLLINAMGDQISGLYSTMIIILVKLQHSLHDDTPQYDADFNASQTPPTVLHFEDHGKSHPAREGDTIALESIRMCSTSRNSDWNDPWRAPV